MTSIISIYRRFPTKESCIEHLEAVRWKGVAHPPLPVHRRASDAKTLVAAATQGPSLPVHRRASDAEEGRLHRLPMPPLPVHRRASDALISMDALPLAPTLPVHRQASDAV